MEKTFEAQGPVDRKVMRCEPPGCPTPGACSCNNTDETLRNYVQVLEHRAKLRQMLKDFMDHHQSRGHPLYAEALDVLKETYP